jgi:hypothetical protein
MASSCKLTPAAARVAALLLASLSWSVLAQPQRVNLAKYQSCTADSAAPGEPASFATDGVVGNGNRWKSDPAVAGPHWLTVTLPLAVQVGSAQLYLGRDDTEPVVNFALQCRSGASWVNIPGATFIGNTATVLNVVFTTPVTASVFRFYSTDAAVRVRELALFPTNGPVGFPIGTDVTLNLAKKRPATASSVDGTSYAKGAVDGYVQNDLGRWKSVGTNGPHTLEIDLQESSRLGSAHLYLGSAGNPTITNFTLEYWTNDTWALIPGGTVTSNTNRELRVPFTSPVAASRVRLNIPGDGSQRVRELLVFAAVAGLPAYPLGTDVILAAPPTTTFDTRGDGFYKIVNRALVNSLIVGPDGASQTHPDTTEEEKHFELLYNLDSDTFRIRNRHTWRCISAQNAGRTPGTAVVDALSYFGMPHQLWRFEDMGGGYFRIVNVWSGLALETDGLSPATVTLAPPSADARQQWQLNYQTHYPKKGTAGYEGDWARFGTSWNYNWGRDTGVSLPPQVVFTPMQHNRGWPAWTTLPEYYVPWHTNSRPLAILGFNEPDRTDQANMTVQQVLDLWPQLEQTDLPLVSPAVATAYGGWLGDFYTQANSRGFRVDFTAVHWYGNPNASGFINHLQSVYNTWGRPIWLTEFSTVDWGGTATWTEEDNYRFLSEFLWRAEDLIWLKRYAIFLFAGDPPANPWDRVGARGNILKSDGATLTAFGELYAAWDADRTIRDRTSYFIQNLATMHRLRASALTNLPSTGDIRRNDASTQWGRVPAPTAGRWYIISLRDGRRLRFDGTTLDLAQPPTSGSSVEWTLNGPDASGYTFIDHPASSKTLRMNRSNDTNGAPTSLGYTMETSGAPSDNTRWRFIRPYQAISTTPPVQLVNLIAVGGVGRVTLLWSPPPATNILHYSLFRRATTNGTYALLVTGLTTRGYLDTNVLQGTTYRYVATVTDWLGSESPPSSEAFAIPLPPRVQIALNPASGQLSLSWPAIAGDYRLMSTTNLVEPIDWRSVSGAGLSNGAWKFSSPVESNLSRFFRIQSP